MITPAVPSWCQDFKPKYARLATSWLLRHVWLLNMCNNVLHSNLWLPAQSGERPWRSETIGAAARKMSGKCARQHHQVGSLVRFGLTTKRITLKLVTKSFFWFFTNDQGLSEPVLDDKLGFENIFWCKTKSKLFKPIFSTHFVVKRPFQGQARCRELFSKPLCRLSQISLYRKMQGLLLNGLSKTSCCGNSGQTLV